MCLIVLYKKSRCFNLALVEIKMDIASSSLDTLKLEPPDDLGYSEDEDDVPRCGVSLNELKTKIKTEYEENPPENLIQNEEVVVEKKTRSKVLPNMKEEPLSDEFEDELEFKVASFLAETSSKRRRKKKGKNTTKSSCKFKCNQCGSLFRYKSTLSYHAKSSCGRGLLTQGNAVVKSAVASCHICGRRLSSRTSLMVHLRIHTGERPFKCGECGQAFTQNAHLKDHVARLHSEGEIFLCRVCNKTFPNRGRLREHAVSHESLRGHQCQECGKRFQTVEKLESHSHETKPYPCPLCAEVCKTRSGLRSHMSRHPPPLACQQCPMTFPSVAAWRQHSNRAHKESGCRATRKCGFCERSFSSDYDLRVHVRSHTGERPYTCEFCGRGFSRKSILGVHRTLHTGQRDFICPQCGEAFNRKSKLDVHLASHLHTALPCQVCNKTFKCKAYLATHMKTHERPADVTCRHCGRGFGSKRALVQHAAKQHALGAVPPLLAIPANFFATDVREEELLGPLALVKAARGGESPLSLVKQEPNYMEEEEELEEEAEAVEVMAGRASSLFPGLFAIKQEQGEEEVVQNGYTTDPDEEEEEYDDEEEEEEESVKDFSMKSTLFSMVQEEPLSMVIGKRSSFLESNHEPISMVTRIKQEP